MTQWQAKLFMSLRDATDETQCTQRIGRAVVELGFNHFTYGLWTPLPVSNPAFHSISNTPEDWQAHYTRHNCAAEDPLLKHALRTLEPLIWDGAIFQKSPSLQACAHAQGLLAGWTQSSLCAKRRRGCLTLFRRSVPPKPAEVRTKAPDVECLLHMADLFFAERIACLHRAPTRVNLTDREVETLRWTADGKTSIEIARILGVSTNTVNFHLRNAIAKLDAVNKASAVAKALIYGVL